jgi:hypothetical protein
LLDSVDRIYSVGLFHPAFASWMIRAWMAFGELAGAPGAAAELAEDAPGLELGVGALAG